jgi:S1-C subfamily serine protease
MVALDDRPVARIDDLHRLMTEERVGVPTKMTVIRGNEKLDLTVTPSESKTSA